MFSLSISLSLSFTLSAGTLMYLLHSVPTRFEAMSLGFSAVSTGQEEVKRFSINFYAHTFLNVVLQELIMLKWDIQICKVLFYPIFFLFCGVESSLRPLLMGWAKRALVKEISINLVVTPEELERSITSSGESKRPICHLLLSVRLKYIHKSDWPSQIPCVVLVTKLNVIMLKGY